MPGKGKALRRVAFLGGDIPQIKSIADIPMPVAHHEQFAAKRSVVLKFRESRDCSGGSCVFFFEVKPMPEPMTTPADPQSMLAQLEPLGFDTQALASCSPEELQAFIQGLAQLQGPTDHDDDEVPDPDGMSPEDQQQMADRYRAMAEKAKKGMDAFCSKNSDNGGPDDPTALNPQATAGVMAEPVPPMAPVHPAPVAGAIPPGQPKSVTHTMKFSEVQLAELKALVASSVAETLKRYGTATVLFRR